MKSKVSRRIGGGAVALLCAWSANARQCPPAWGALGAGPNNYVYISTIWDPDGPTGPVLPRLVVGGEFTSPGSHILMYDNGVWQPIGTGFGAYVAGLATLPNGDLVAAGGFSGGVARWTGSAWTLLGGGVSGAGNEMAVAPNGDLILVGAFTTAGGVTVNNVARWTGSAWVALGAGVTGTIDSVAVAPSGEVYIGGAGLVAAGGIPVNGIARFDGTQWSALGTGVRKLNGDRGAVASILALPNGEIIAGGVFTTAGSVTSTGVARWTGAGWVSMNGGFNPENSASQGGSVFGLTRMPNGDVVAGGGIYASAVGATMYGVARWNGSIWNAIGSGIGTASSEATVPAVLALPNGDILAGGQFSVPANRIALWSAKMGPWIATHPAPTTSACTHPGAVALNAAVIPSLYPSVTYSWRKNGSPIPPSPRITGISGPTLTINPPLPSDAGAYTCVVTDACGASVSKAATLSIGGLPGDANFDGSLNFLDLNLVLSNFGASVSSGFDGDVDGDGVVSFADLNLVLSAFGQSCV